MMKEMLAMRDSGKLNEVQMKWFVKTKPREELYDLQNDPWELNNLAADSKHEPTLIKLRKEMDRWIAEVKDLGSIEEKQLISQMWQGGDHPPITEDVIISFSKGTTATLSCKTMGASIGFKVINDGAGEPGSWSVYTEPVKLLKGQTIIAVAQRIGYEKSKVMAVKYE
jgi:hypothetical protein